MFAFVSGKVPVAQLHMMVRNTLGHLKFSGEVSERASLLWTLQQSRSNMPVFSWENAVDASNTLVFFLQLPPQRALIGLTRFDIGYRMVKIKTLWDMIITDHIHAVKWFIRKIFERVYWFMPSPIQQLTMSFSTSSINEEARCNTCDRC